MGYVLYSIYFYHEMPTETNETGLSCGETQPFPHLADDFRFPRLGETIEAQISAIESADVSFDQ